MSILYPNQNNKNFIINGNFDVWQRGTSQTITGYGSDDRWLNVNNGATCTFSRQSFALGQTDVPNNPKYFSRINITNSIAGSAVNKQHRLELVKRLSGETVTLSFWAKADTNRNIATDIVQFFGTGSSDPQVDGTAIKVTTYNLTTSWQKFTSTFTFPSVAGKDFQSDDFRINLVFWFSADSTWDSRTNNLGLQTGTFDISQVQLEYGRYATDFEIEPYIKTFKKCQRYYEKVLVAVGGWANTSTDPGIQFNFATRKHGTPTITIEQTFEAQNIWFNLGFFNISVDGGIFRCVISTDNPFWETLELSAESEL